MSKGLPGSPPGEMLPAMWHTQWGDRVLEGAEGALFRAGLASLVCVLEDEDDDPPWETGVGVFDSLTLPSKLAMLEYVGRALLLRSVPCPRLTAVTEGAAAAVYEHIQWLLDEEEGCERQRWRELVAAAYVEAGLTRKRPSTRVFSPSRWRRRVDSLMDRVFWDCDWEHASTLDLPPEAARMVKEWTGIIDDYYTAVAADPSAVELRRIRRSLRRVSRERVNGTAKPRIAVGRTE